MMEARMAEAQRRGRQTMVAAVDTANGASIGFHQRLGFVQVARMPEIGPKFGRWLDLAILQVKLDDRRVP